MKSGEGFAVPRVFPSYLGIRLNADLGHSTASSVIRWGDDSSHRPKVLRLLKDPLRRIGVITPDGRAYGFIASICVLSFRAGVEVASIMSAAWICALASSRSPRL